MLSKVPWVPHRLTVLFSSSVRHRGCLLSSVRTILASCNLSDSLLMIKKLPWVLVCYRKAENGCCRPLESVGRVFRLCRKFQALGRACRVALWLRILGRSASSRRQLNPVEMVACRLCHIEGTCPQRSLV